MYTNQCKNFNGEYVVVWNNNKQIILGPEQFYGTLFCPVNFYYANTLQDIELFITTNNLLLSNNILE